VIVQTLLLSSDAGVTLVTVGGGGPFTVSMMSVFDPCPSGLKTWTGCSPWSQSERRSSGAMRIQIVVEVGAGSKLGYSKL